MPAASAIACRYGHAPSNSRATDANCRRRVAVAAWCPWARSTRARWAGTRNRRTECGRRAEYRGAAFSRSAAVVHRSADPRPGCRRARSSPTTMPGWSVTHAPITAARAPCGCARIAASTRSASSAGTNATQLALVGNVERVKAQQAAGVADLRGDRQRPLIERDPDSRRPGDLVERRGHTAAGRDRAAHAVGAGVDHRRDQAVQRGGVAGDGGGELQSFAATHHRHSVHPDVTADDDRIAGVARAAGGCRRARRPDRCPRC